MFSGIIEAKSKIEIVRELNSAFEIGIKLPEIFNDLKTGDSIATDGVCLTLEKIENNLMYFTVGAETLKVLERTLASDWQDRIVNLERSLRFGDRVHGHLVTGHVECMGMVIERKYLGDCLVLKISTPQLLSSFLWKKGSVTVNGVSLTINEIELASESKEGTIEVCLIPETLFRTNLELLSLRQKVCLEPDYMAKALLHRFNLEKKEVRNGSSI